MFFTSSVWVYCRTPVERTDPIPGDAVLKNVFNAQFGYYCLDFLQCRYTTHFLLSYRAQSNNILKTSLAHPKKDLYLELRTSFNNYDLYNFVKVALL